MSYDEQEARKSRVVVETPNSRREVTHTEAVRGDRDGISGATVGVIVVVAIALVTILILFLMNGQTDDNLALQQQPVQPSTTIVQQPAAQQPPVIIQQAPPAPQQAPIIITQPAPSGGSTSGSNDYAIQSEVDKRILDDPNLSTLGVTVSVINGKATLMGIVKSESIKQQFEKLVRGVRGVKEIDNRIIIG